MKVKAMREFAKLYNYDDIGQVLVVQDQTDPEVKISLIPEGLGLCGPTFTFDDFDKCDEFFSKLDREGVYQVANKAIEAFKDL